MNETGWKRRLDAAIDKAVASGTPLAELSRKTGLLAKRSVGRNLVQQVRNNPQANPTIEMLTAICDAVGVSIGEVFYGISLSKEDDRVFRQYLRLRDSKPHLLNELLSGIEQDHEKGNTHSDGSADIAEKP